MASSIAVPKEICYVDKNTLLVYGQSSAASAVHFELYILQNNSPTVVDSVTLLGSELGRTYLMHSCDYTSGAWFRSTNEGEEHAFYDPGTKQLFKVNNPTNTKKLISMANSKRGHFVVSIWDSAGISSTLGYNSVNNTGAFSLMPSSSLFENSWLFFKITRLDVADNGVTPDKGKIYYICLGKSISSQIGNTAVTNFRQKYAADYIHQELFYFNRIRIIHSTCQQLNPIGYTFEKAPPSNRIVKNFLKIDSLSDVIAVQA